MTRSPSAASAGPMAREAVPAATETWARRRSQRSAGKGKCVGSGWAATPDLTLPVGWKKAGSEVLLKKPWKEDTWATTLSKAVGTEGE